MPSLHCKTSRIKFVEITQNKLQNELSLTPGGSRCEAQCTEKDKNMILAVSGKGQDGPCDFYIRSYHLSHTSDFDAQ